MTDTLKNEKGEDVKLKPPSGNELPQKGFTPGESGYCAPAKDGDAVTIAVDPASERLHLLDPFKPRKVEDFQDLFLLAKVEGKCTTDHISPAGKWLRFRGHLNNISDNFLIGGVNAFREEIGKGKSQLDGEVDSFSQVARSYKSAGKGWVVVGDENYGEGSSREHAAMEPRYLGGNIIIVKSFARIHETNLKKQGMLAVTFDNPEDYAKIQEDDRLAVIDLAQFAPETPLTLQITHSDGSVEKIKLKHTYNEHQIKWFWAGSALNLIKEG